MFVLGIDPGLSRCGYCVLEAVATTQRPRVRALGVLRTPPDAPVWDRLAMIQGDIQALMGEFQVGDVALERVVFGANARTASGVIQAAGVIMAEAVRSGALVAEYGPNQVKEAVTGWGAAPKAQVASMVATLLGLAAVPDPPDAADAAAVALCHLAMTPLRAATTSASGVAR